MTSLRQWLPLILQSVLFLGVAYMYATAQEHRITVVEESLKNHSDILTRYDGYHNTAMRQLNELQRATDRLIALEEFIHGQ